MYQMSIYVIYIYMTIKKLEHQDVFVAAPLISICGATHPNQPGKDHRLTRALPPRFLGAPAFDCFSADALRAYENFAEPTAGSCMHLYMSFSKVS